jgi:hypothetical protein
MDRSRLASNAPGALQTSVTQRHVKAEVIHCVGGVKLDALRGYETYNAHRPHRPHQGIADARPLTPLPDPITDRNQLAQPRIRRRDRIGGVLHQYQHAA